jgi:hypothetical protein
MPNKRTVLLFDEIEKLQDDDILYAIRPADGFDRDKKVKRSNLMKTPFYDDDGNIVIDSDGDFVYGNFDKSSIICRPGDDLKAKYLEATSLLSSHDRVRMILFPGEYEINDDDWYINVDRVDIIGLGSVKKEVGCEPAVLLTGDYTIYLLNVESRIKGISTGLKPFKISRLNAGAIIENCFGGNFSFGYSDDVEPLIIEGIMINCEGNNQSFGRSFTNSCVFESTAKLVNCRAGANSFGYSSSGAVSVNGFFKNCHGGTTCFGTSATGTIDMPGRFEDCRAGNTSFGVNNGATITISGFFKNCEAGFSTSGRCFGNGALSTVTIGGYFENCSTPGQFGADPIYTIITATMVSCSGGNLSFYSNNMTGKVLFCRWTDTGARSVGTGGKYRFCLDGNWTETNVG